MLQSFATIVLLVCIISVSQVYKSFSTSTDYQTRDLLDSELYMDVDFDDDNVTITKCYE